MARAGGRESPRGLGDDNACHRRCTQRVERATEISRQPKIIEHGRSHREYDVSPRIALKHVERAGQLKDMKNKSPQNAKATSDPLDRFDGAFRTRFGSS